MKHNKNRKEQKKTAQIKHFERKCLTRVGEILDNQEIINLLRRNKLEFIDRCSNTITRWKYIHKDKEYMVIYNKNTKVIVTIIPYKEGYENPLPGDYYWWLK